MSTKFCPVCEKVMVKDMSSGMVMFHCPVCTKQIAGGDADAIIASETLDGAESLEGWELFLSNASFDRTNQQVARDCTRCGLDYMTQVRILEREAIFYTCKCGLILHGDGTPFRLERKAAAPATETKTVQGGVAAAEPKKQAPSAKGVNADTEESDISDFIEITGTEQDTAAS